MRVRHSLEDVGMGKALQQLHLFQSLGKGEPLVDLEDHDLVGGYVPDLREGVKKNSIYDCLLSHEFSLAHVHTFEHS